MRVDAKGFFLYWVDQNNELDILDIATIRDVRTGQYAKRPKVRILDNLSHHGVYSIFTLLSRLRLHLLWVCYSDPSKISPVAGHSILRRLSR